MAETTNQIKLTVNGREYDLKVTRDTKLADVLRQDLGLTGTKIGCRDGPCGSCVWPARRADGKNVLTVEGLAASWGEPGELHPLQKAFVDHGAV